MKATLLSLVLAHCILNTYCMDELFSSQAVLPLAPVHPLRTQLNNAIRTNDEAQLILILTQDFPLNTPGTQADHDDPPMCVAARYGRKNIIETLVANFEASVDIFNGNGDTPLHTAAWFGQIDAMKLLIGCNASLCTKNIWGQTPLHVALDREHPNYKLITLLLKKGSPVNEPDDDGNTAAHLSYMINDEQILDLLDDYDVNWNYPNKEGKKPHDLAGKKIQMPIFPSPPPPPHKEEITLESNFDEALGSWEVPPPIQKEKQPIISWFSFPDIIQNEENALSTEEEFHTAQEDKSDANSQDSNSHDSSSSTILFLFDSYDKELSSEAISE